MEVKRRKISYGIWQLLNRGGDAFRKDVADELSVHEVIAICGELKTEHLLDMLSAHDDDLVSWDPSDPEDYLRKDSPVRIEVAKIKASLEAAGLYPLNMITCCLHGHDLFSNGGFSNPDPVKRLLALKKALRAAWIGNELGASIITYWVARDGYEVALAVPWEDTNPANPEQGPYTWIAYALNLIQTACQMNGYSIKRGTVEPKIDEPRGSSFIPLTGTALWLISYLDDSNFWGVNPEITQHSSMGNQDPFLEVCQAVLADKLPMVHMGGQINGVFDCDFLLLFGPDGVKRMVQILCYLQQVGWDGIIEFDCRRFASDIVPGIENRRMGIRELIIHCTRSYRALEQIVVPRVLEQPDLLAAQQEIWQPAHLGDTPAANFMGDLFEHSPTAVAVETVVHAQIPNLQAVRETPAVCGQVEEAFNRAFLGITAAQIDAVLAPESVEERVEATT